MGIKQFYNDNTEITERIRRRFRHAFRASLFPILVMYFIHVWYDDTTDTGPKFYRVPSQSQGNGLRILCESFTLKMLQKGKAQFRQAILSGDRSYSIGGLAS